MNGEKKKRLKKYANYTIFWGCIFYILVSILLVLSVLAIYEKITGVFLSIYIAWMINALLLFFSFHPLFEDLKNWVVNPSNRASMEKLFLISGFILGVGFTIFFIGIILFVLKLKQ